MPLLLRLPSVPKIRRRVLLEMQISTDWLLQQKALGLTGGQCGLDWKLHLQLHSAQFLSELPKQSRVHLKQQGEPLSSSQHSASEREVFGPEVPNRPRPPVGHQWETLFGQLFPEFPSELLVSADPGKGKGMPILGGGISAQSTPVYLFDSYFLGPFPEWLRCGVLLLETNRKEKDSQTSRPNNGESEAFAKRIHLLEEFSA